MDSSILAHLLASLSAKPFQCDQVDNVYNELEYKIANEYPEARPAEIRKAIDKALEVAQGLGVISLVNEAVRVTFKADANAKLAPSIDVGSDDSMDDDADGGEDKKTSRRKNPRPKKRAPLSEAERESFMILPARKNVKKGLKVARDRLRQPRPTRARRRSRQRSSRRTSRRRISRRRR